MRKLFYVIVLLSFVLMTGCTARLIDFTIISSKNVGISVPKYEKRVVGKGNSIKSALDDALEQVSGYDALMDGVVYQSSYYCVFFYIIVYKVEGTPVKLSDLKADMNGNEFNDYCKKNKIIYH